MENNTMFNNFNTFFLIEKNKKTGSLYVKKGETLRILYFLQGKFAYGHSNLKGERLLDVISSSGTLSPEYIEDVVNNLVPGESLGKIFVDRGYLTPMQLTKLVEKQQKMIFFSVLFLKDGEFRFFEEELPSNITPLNIDIPQMIKEGIYQSNDRVLIATLMGSLETTYEKGESEYSDYIGEKEKSVLDKLEDKASLFELIKKSSYEEFETLKILLFLKVIGAIKEYEDKESVFEEENFPEEEEEENREDFSSIFSADDEEIDKAFKRVEKESEKKDLIENKDEKREEIEEKEERIFNKHEDFDEEDKELKFKKLLILIGIILIVIIIGSIFYLKNKLLNQEKLSQIKKPEIVNVEKRPVKPVVDNFKEKEIKEESVTGREEKIKKSPKDKELKKKQTLENKIIKEKKKEIKAPSKKEEKNLNSASRGIVKGNVLPDYTSLIRNRRFSLAAKKYQLALEQINADYSILLEVDCLLDSVKNAYIRGSFSKKLFIIKRKVRGKSCYAVFWGLYKNQTEAEKELSLYVPSFFKRQNPKPSIVLIKKYLE